MNKVNWSYENNVPLDYYDFKGKHKCLLCPEKILTTD